MTPFLHVTFPPTSDSSSKNAILPENLNSLMKTGKFNKVPVMIGCSAQEGLLANLCKDLIFTFLCCFFFFFFFYLLSVFHVM